MRRRRVAYDHVHHFIAVVDQRTGRNLTKWRCSCGIKVRDRAVAEALDGKSL